MRKFDDDRDHVWPSKGSNPIMSIPVEIETNHSYDWQAMEFNPLRSIRGSFNWNWTPEEYRWWHENEETLEGYERFEEMKILYAADIAKRSWPICSTIKRLWIFDLVKNAMHWR